MVIFATGVLTGALAMRHTQRLQSPVPPHEPPAAHPTSPVSVGVLRLEFLRRAQRELDLTLKQRQQIDTLLRESQERTRQIMKPVAPELNAELQRTKELFLEVLTPEQRTRFEQMMKRQQQRPHDSRHPRGSQTSAPAATPGR